MATLRKVNVLVVEDVQGVRAYSLDRILYHLGRSELSDIQILGPEVSRNHATLLRIPREDGNFSYRLVDGDSRTKKPSANGTYVNGTLVSSYELNNNDYIVFARGVAAKFLFLVPEAAERAINSPTPLMQDLGPDLQPDVRASVYGAMTPTIDQAIPNHRVATTPTPNMTTVFNTKPSESKSNVSQTKSVTHKRGRKLQYGRLGQFFLRTAALNEDDLEQILQEQAQTEKRLGELLVERGVISQDDLDRALQNQQIQLGEILVKRQYITQDQLKQALLRQIQTKEPLGQILVREGWVTLPEIEQALKEQKWRRNGFWFLD